MDIDQTIKQLTGGKSIGALKSMLGATDFVQDENSLTFKFKGFNKANMVRIVLNDMDLYDLEFYKLKLPDIKNVKTISNVYGDELKHTFTNYTGLDTSL